MGKKLLTGALTAFLLVPQIAQAPIRKISYQPIKKAIILEETFGKYTRENEEKGKALLKKFDDLAHYRTDNFYEDDMQTLVARLMLGETEDRPDIEKIAIVWTSLNRAKKYDSDIRTEILRGYQYSCFNSGTDSSIFLKIPLQHNESDFLRDLKLAEGFLEGKFRDPTHGATHYYNPDLVGKPDWVRSMISLGRIGAHRFYKDKD